MSRTDPDRTPPPVECEVGETVRAGASRTPGAPGGEDELAHIQSMLLPFHLYEPGTLYTHEDDVDLLAYVLSDLTPGAKVHQVGVEVPTSAKGPDYPFTSRLNHLRHQVGPDSLGQVTTPGANDFLPG